MDIILMSRNRDGRLAGHIGDMVCFPDRKCDTLIEGLNACTITHTGYDRHDRPYAFITGAPLKFEALSDKEIVGYLQEREACTVARYGRIYECSAYGELAWFQSTDRLHRYTFAKLDGQIMDIPADSVFSYIPHWSLVASRNIDIFDLIAHEKCGVSFREATGFTPFPFSADPLAAESTVYHGELVEEAWDYGYINLRTLIGVEWAEFNRNCPVEVLDDFTAAELDTIKTFCTQLNKAAKDRFVAMSRKGKICLTTNPFACVDGKTHIIELRR